MTTDLPARDRNTFGRLIRQHSPAPLGAEVIEALYAHFLELRRWSRSMSLVGPGAADSILRRHYGEALVALPLLPARGANLVDLGSGAGFPGFVLAAARPDLRTTLVEARERKCSFLQAASRKAALPIRCLNARVGVPLPEALPKPLDILTLRALKLDQGVWEALVSRLGPDGRILLWVGAELPPFGDLLEVRRETPLPGAERRRIVELVPRDRSGTTRG